MRVVSSLLIYISLSLVSAQEQGMKNRPQEQERIPTTLTEAHAELERILSPQELAKIDAMPSEDDMIQYHFGLGAGIRYRWGLWRDSPLAKHMREMGFAHPDDMSNVILKTFWRKRHGQNLRLRELAAIAKNSMTGAWKTEVEKKNRIRFQKARTAIQELAIMAFLSVVLLVGGLACSILAKTSRFKQGVSTSSGRHHPSKAYARLDRIAFALMVFGILLLLVFLRALHFQE